MSRKTCQVYGKPDLMYYVPELYDCEDQKMPLLYPLQDVDEVERLFCKEYPLFVCSPLFIDALNILVGNVANFALPESVEEAVDLYGDLYTSACVTLVSVSLNTSKLM